MSCNCKIQAVVVLLLGIIWILTDTLWLGPEKWTYTDATILKHEMEVNSSQIYKKNDCEYVNIYDVPSLANRNGTFITFDKYKSYSLSFCKWNWFLCPAFFPLLYWISWSRYKLHGTTPFFFREWNLSR